MEIQTSLLKEFKKGATVDLDIDLVILREKKIENCIGCYQCLEKAICSIQDDMEEIRTLIEKAKILVLASPMYWCGVTGLMKTFIDRLFYYYHPDTKGRMLGKRAMIITPMNQSNVVYESETLVQFYSRLLNCLGIRLIDMFFSVESCDRVTLKTSLNISRQHMRLEEILRCYYKIMKIIYRQQRLIL